MTSSVEHFERFEYKFFAPPARVESVLRVVDAFMEQDAVSQRAGASQVNTSLYFDSPTFAFLEQHISGSPDRIKLRVRFYGDTPKGECFFEIKRRQGAVVMKKRAVLPLPLARGVVDDVTRKLPEPNPALETFQYLAVRCQAAPKLLVRARRRAFRALDRGLDTRLTIDDGMAWQPVRRHEPLMPRPAAWRPLLQADDERVLVELKFRDARPWWLGAIVGALAPWRVSFSKYVTAAVAARRDPLRALDAA